MIAILNYKLESYPTCPEFVSALLCSCVPREITWTHRTTCIQEYVKHKLSISDASQRVFGTETTIHPRQQLQNINEVVEYFRHNWELPQMPWAQYMCGNIILCFAAQTKISKMNQQHESDCQRGSGMARPNPYEHLTVDNLAWTSSCVFKLVERVQFWIFKRSKIL